MKRNDWILYGGAALVAYGMVKYSQKQKLCKGEWLTSMGVNRHERYLKPGFVGSPSAERLRNVKPADLFKVVFGNVRSNEGPVSSFIMVPVEIQVGEGGNLVSWPVCRIGTQGFRGDSAPLGASIPYEEAFSSTRFIRMDYDGPVTLDDISS